uniref:Valine--tRNA ligase, mitochondrial n=1 Tax=Tetraselmis sp. GSL018 TaxID=582737 RepID=A0A061RC03_9CHLO
MQRIIDAARATPKGAKKDTAAAMPKGYCPPAVEAAWYDWWESSGFFKPDMDSGKPSFVIVIPPPNVTGTLHLGHALTNAIQDTIVRWRRMSGYNTLWVPGTDHAGIATQTVVEKKLQRERGISRHDLGRERFLEEVYKWVDEYGGRICGQLRRIGSSVDWDRQVFTMDGSRSEAVLEAFVRMYDQGKIYRDNRLVNWCCTLKTAVSDIEVDYIDVPTRTLMSVPGYKDPVEFGVLQSFAYPLADGAEGEVVVATTRIETMLGDTAVAIHPDDARYAHLHGKHVVHPVNGRKIPIVCDAELVDMSFGTGCVKITPAHDPNDFATGKRHGLEFINVFDDDGRINANGGPFEGQRRFEARRTVTEFLKEKGLFRGTEPNPMRLGLCSRSKDVIEPMLKPQWWVDCKQMAADGCAAVRDGRMKILPKEFEATWFRWLENIRDWCVSRQLWWGHRIPAYYCQLDGDASLPGTTTEDMSRWVVGRSPEEARRRAEEKFPGREVTLLQDEDVLDTWFSSGLFPFSVFCWPNNTADLAKFFPTSLLETGHDILFFWVARMVMMSMALTGEVPFKEVYLHSMVRDAHGRKMSKSLGNVIDPIHVIEGISLEGLHETLEGGNLDQKEIKRAREGQKADFPDGIEECGTDALRFALCSYTSQARDINLDIKRVVAYRHWCNKLWNAIKFAMLNLDEAFSPKLPAELPVAELSAPCRWIISRLNAAVRATAEAMEGYDFSGATTAIYSFWQYEVCDVFIELMKPVMARGSEAEKDATRNALWLCLDRGLRLLHPFMPFVTEELWQRLPQPRGAPAPPSVMLAEYPAPADGWDAPALEADMAYALDVVGKVRGLRADYNLAAKQRPQLFIACSDPRRRAVLAGLAGEVATLGSCSAAECLAEGAAAPASCGVKICDEATTVYLLLQGVLDPKLELGKLEKKKADIEGKREALAKKMAMPSYAEKTPAKMKEADQSTLEKLAAELSAAEAAMEGFRNMIA